MLIINITTIILLLFLTVTNNDDVNRKYKYLKY